MRQVLLCGWSRRCVQAIVTSNSIQFRCSFKVMIVVGFVILSWKRDCYTFVLVVVVCLFFPFWQVMSDTLITTLIMYYCACKRRIIIDDATTKPASFTTKRLRV